VFLRYSLKCIRGDCIVAIVFGLVAFNDCRIASLTRMEMWDNIMLVEFCTFSTSQQKEKREREKQGKTKSIC